MLKEAGYPNGFDAGEITSGPPYHSLAEGMVNYLQAVGIRIKMRPMERAALIAALKEKKLTGLTSGGTGILGNAATRLEPFVELGEFARIGYPDIDELYKQQATERDYKNARRCCTRSSVSCTNVPCMPRSTNWYGPMVLAHVSPRLALD